jgi:hypothetical protein
MTMLVSQEKLMEIAFFIGAFVLLVALIYGTLQYHYRNRAATRIGGEVARALPQGRSVGTLCSADV